MLLSIKYLLCSCWLTLFVSGSSLSHAFQVSPIFPYKEHPSLVENPADTGRLLKFTSGVRSILEDSQGNIWFGSHAEGLGLYDGKKVSYFTVEDGLSHNQVRSIYEDKEGTVWFEGGIGISSYDGETITKHSVKNYSSKNTWQLEPDDLWFKGDEITGFHAKEGQPGVYRLDGFELIFLAFPFEIPDGQNSYFSVSTPFVRGKNGRIWLGTYGGVVGYDGENLTLIDEKSLGLNEKTGQLHVRSLMEDHQGNLWIGNNGMGVLKYDGDTVINFSQSQGLLSKNSLRTGGYRSPAGSLEHVFSISEDADGFIWFGDRDTGLWRYDGKTMKNYTRLDGLPTHHIWQIYETKQGDLWLAMGDGSVYQKQGDVFIRVF